MNDEPIYMMNEQAVLGFEEFQMSDEVTREEICTKCGKRKKDCTCKKIK